MMKQTDFYLAVCTALCSATAFAGQVQEAAACVHIGDDAARLACFDRVYAPKLDAENATAADTKSVDLLQTYASSVENRRAEVVFAEAENAAYATEHRQTTLERLFDLERNSSSGLLSVREHEPMYLMPALYNSSPNYYPSTPTRGEAVEEAQVQQRRLETKMQISFKTKLMEDVFKTRADLWFGYTQQSNWQIYNQGRKSAPFRNTDYTPELLLTQPVKAALPFGGRLRMLGVGFVHQSNGRSQPLSRSWNRVYLMAGMEWGKLTVVPRVWTMTDKKDRRNDNPDIGRYMGYGDVKWSYQFNDKHALSGLLRYHLGRGNGALRLDYTFPIKGKLKAYVQGFHGYGENLIDYNRKQTSLGIGLMLRDWDGI